MPEPRTLPFKISALVFVRNESGKFLLIRRNKAPNFGLWSPIGGKLEMAEGESPFECAIRETREEIGLELSEPDLRMFAMISEKSYEGGTHWLMFLFDVKKRICALPEDISEGRFGLFGADEIENLDIPETDRVLLWGVWKKYSQNGFAAMRAECGNGVRAAIEQAETFGKSLKI